MTPPVAKLEIGNSFQKFFDNLIGFIPKLIGFLLILLIGYIIAKLVRTAITKALQGAGLDRALHSGQSGQYVERISPGASPSKLVGSIAYYFILLTAVGIAISQLGGQGAQDLLGTIVAYLPKVVAAIIILVIAGVIATAVGALVTRTMGDTPTGKVVATIVPTVVLAIAVFMALDQLEIAPDIVRITYTALIGALALGMALAFGLGGRDVASQMLSSAYQTGQANRGQVKQDLQQGKQRAQQDAQQVQQAAQQRSQQGGGQQGGQQGGGGTQRYSSI